MDITHINVHLIHPFNFRNEKKPSYIRKKRETNVEF
jgi:hypothetical protein